MIACGPSASMWVYTGEYRDVDVELANYDAVTQKDIRDYPDAYPIHRSTVIAFGPLLELNGVAGQRGVSSVWRAGGLPGIGSPAARPRKTSLYFQYERFGACSTFVPSSLARTTIGRVSGFTHGSA